MESMEVFEGKFSGKEYNPREYNAIVYDYFQQIRLEKERESQAKKSITNCINWLAKEFGYAKKDIETWVALKIEETEKGVHYKETAVEFNNILKANREKFGESSDLEERIEREGAMTLNEAYESGYLTTEEDED